MKTSKDQLKQIVRELMVEILSEGLGNFAPSRPSVAGTVREQASARRRPEFDPRLDTKLTGNRLPTDALKQAIRENSGGNPVLADMLADTAMTTLPNQLANGDRMGRPGEGTGTSMAALRQGAPLQEQFTGDPSDHFEGAEARADGSSHWADLAFMTPGKKSA